MKKSTINRTIVHEAPQKNLKPHYHFTSEDLQKKIAQKAFEIYEGRGCLPDGDMSDWLEAEKIILEEEARTS